MNLSCLLQLFLCNKGVLFLREPLGKELFFPEEFEVVLKPVLPLLVLCNPSKVHVCSSPAPCASMLNMNHYSAELGQLLPSR